MFDYVKALIELRKEHPGFRMTTAKRISERIRFAEMPSGLISYNIYGWSAGEKWRTIWVIFNGTGKEQRMLSFGHWRYAILNNTIVQDKKEEMGEIIMSPYSCSIMYRKE